MFGILLLPLDNYGVNESSQRIKISLVRILVGSWSCSVSIVTRTAGVRFSAEAQEDIFTFAIASTLALGPTQLPIQWVPGILSPELRRPGCEDYHSPASSAEVKNTWSYTSTPHTSSWRGV
jgi:hypothetical protein